MDVALLVGSNYYESVGKGSITVYKSEVQARQLAYELNNSPEMAEHDFYTVEVVQVSE
jgi:hypothetical protein